MNVVEFEQKTLPKGRTSKLDRFCDDIIYLKERNYTNKQIKEWLELNSVFISEESVRLFILKIKKSIEKPNISTDGNVLLHELSTREVANKSGICPSLIQLSSI